MNVVLDSGSSKRSASDRIRLLKSSKRAMADEMIALLTPCLWLGGLKATSVKQHHAMAGMV
jgi:hypothetical protein